MKIVFATDHAGLVLKNTLLAYVRDELGYEVEDRGAHEEDPHDDYPDFIAAAARLVSIQPGTTRGIVLGGSGQGEAMTANRFPGVRAAVYYGGPRSILMLSREHNDANVLALGARFLEVPAAKAAVKEWLETPFSGEERHARRIRKIESAAEDF